MNLKCFTTLQPVAVLLLTLGMTIPASSLMAQDTPIISGGTGFFSNTNGGKTSYQTIAVPVLAAPIGDHILIEGRANILETFSPKRDGTYNHSRFLGLSYMQADYIASKHVTLVGGYFLTPFGTYNERLFPIWIGNFQDVPLIFGIGTMGSASGTGGMIRGNAVSTEKVSISYAAYLSAGSTNVRVNSSRATGGQVSAYFPKARLEVGTSYGRRFENEHENNYGTHLWWQPQKIPLAVRSEYAHAPHSQGYWIETDYRLSQIHGADSWIGRLDTVARVQQAFRNSADRTDGLPSTDTQRIDFGLDYHAPHEVRVNTSYGRTFTSGGNANVWETGIVYRFLLPVWKDKK